MEKILLASDCQKLLKVVNIEKNSKPLYISNKVPSTEPSDYTKQFLEHFSEEDLFFDIPDFLPLGLQTLPKFCSETTLTPPPELAATKLNNQISNKSLDKGNDESPLNTQLLTPELIVETNNEIPHYYPLSDSLLSPVSGSLPISSDFFSQSFDNYGDGENNYCDNNNNNNNSSSSNNNGNEKITSHDNINDVKVDSSSRMNDINNLGRAKYVCLVCKKGFKRPSSLNTHSNIHTGFKPYSCPHQNCDKTFNAKSNMLRHYKLHFKITSGAYQLPSGEIILNKPTTKQLLQSEKK